MLVPTPGIARAEGREARSYPWKWPCRGSGKTRRLPRHGKRKRARAHPHSGRRNQDARRPFRPSSKPSTEGGRVVGAEVGDRPQVVEVHRVDRAGVGDHDRDPAAERRELPAQRVHVNGFAVAGSRVAQEMERLEFDVGSRRVAGVDVASHRPDMPVTLTGSERLGLGLWNSLPATLAVELTLFALGVAVYQRATAPKDRTGSLAFAGLVAFLL